jgi:gas vesicle protein
MRRKSQKANRKVSPGKIITGVLAGGMIGATLRWLTAPTAGAETRRQFRSHVMNARDRAKTAADNIESRARELAEEVSKDVEPFGETATAHRKPS